MKQYMGYFVSPSGVIINNFGHIIKPFMSGKNKAYKQVSLYLNGKRKNIFVHRLIAELYIDNPYNLPQVNHKDGNKLNNDIGNLEWCTMAQNINHSFINNLHCNHKKVVYQRSQSGIINIYESIRSCAKILGVNESSIRKACKGMYNIHGYSFSFN